MSKKPKTPTAKEIARGEKRRAVIEAIQRGEPVTVVARVHGLPLRTVFLWLAKYRQGGWHALLEGKRSGGPPKVSGPILAWLYNAITLGDPRQYHFEFCWWTLQIVRQMLRQQHCIQLSKSAVSRLLKQLGLSPQRPLYK